jgi:hypothetical protein
MYGDFIAKAEYYREFFVRHADRIQFGTDACDEDDVASNCWLADTVYNFITTNTDFEIYGVNSRGLALPDDAAEKILAGNFLRRVGETPKTINKEVLKRYILKYRHLIRDEHVRANVDAALMQL